MTSGRDFEDSDGVIMIWNAQIGHVPAGAQTSAFLRTERLARRYRRRTFVYRGKVHGVSATAGLR